MSSTSQQHLSSDNMRMIDAALARVRILYNLKSQAPKKNSMSPPSWWANSRRGIRPKTACTTSSSDRQIPRCTPTGSRRCANRFSDGAKAGRSPCPGLHSQTSPRPLKRGARCLVCQCDRRDSLSRHDQQAWAPALVWVQTSPLRPAAFAHASTASTASGSPALFCP